MTHTHRHFRVCACTRACVCVCSIKMYKACTHMYNVLYINIILYRNILLCVFGKIALIKTGDMLGASFPSGLHWDIFIAIKVDAGISITKQLSGEHIEHTQHSCICRVTLMQVTLYACIYSSDFTVVFCPKKKKVIASQCRYASWCACVWNPMANLVYTCTFSQKRSASTYV